MEDQILSLAKSLISIPSVKGNTKALHEVLELAKKELSGFTIEEFESNGIESFLVYAGKIRPKKFKIILNAHLDVVPGKPQQFKPFEKNGRLYGRGAYDVKGAATVMIFLFKEMAKEIKYPLGLQIVTDEEQVGPNGTKFQIEKGVRAEFVITGEPTNFAIANKMKGIIKARVTTKGTPSHSAYPWRGKNAILAMRDFLYELEKVYPQVLTESWKTTASPVLIGTSNKVNNIIPFDCEVLIDFRYTPEEGGLEKIAKKIKSILPKSAKLDIDLNEPAHYTSEKNINIVKLREAVRVITKKIAPIIVRHGGNDLIHFTKVKNDGVEFGPVGSGHHSDNEWIEIKSLETYYKILEEFLKTLK